MLRPEMSAVLALLRKLMASLFASRTTPAAAGFALAEVRLPTLLKVCVAVHVCAAASAGTQLAPPLLLFIFQQWEALSGQRMSEPAMPAGAVDSAPLMAMELSLLSMLVEGVCPPRSS